MRERPTHIGGAIAQGIGSVESVSAAVRALDAVDDNGKAIVLGSDAGIALTLPRPKSGLRFRFIIGVAPSADYTIATHGGDNVLFGGINELEVDTTEDGPYASGADTLTFVSGIAVEGDYVEMLCDGTNWYLNGQTNADGGITFATT
ncbi:MAG: hypothetical protein N0E44_18205 [Candidatus Thiodiazotropha lotti]|nr:hypothetical protein [Candidatus Thiodiazotropha lotti]MCW4221817.1 hypothetical protein [Candidatus Thiodiazotropha lotti]